MAKKIFWSWQSDTDARVSRNLIREALVMALAKIGSEYEEADRPEIDQDTKDVAGTPDIVASILEKIDAASVFVGDATPAIRCPKSGKVFLNPNVMIEYGYAKKALTSNRVVLVWNIAFVDARPEDLPFDLRGRRAPISYSLAEDATKEEYRKARQWVAEELERRVRSALGTVPAPPAPIASWQDGMEDGHGWAGSDSPLTINPRVSSSEKVTLLGKSGFYARILPVHFQPAVDIMQRFQRDRIYVFPLGGTSSFTDGNTTGGVANRRHAKSDPEGVASSMTRWWRSTGEIWGAAEEATYERNGERFFADEYVFKHWVSFLRYHLELSKSLGGGAAHHVRLGLVGMDDVSWAPGTLDPYERTLCLESRIDFEGMIDDHSKEAVCGLVKQAADQVRDAFGLSHLDETRFRLQYEGS
ncbi:hypothetical protein [Sphingopyxis sp.]|uniref:hypothetical protein n=1 Tax=Sphingopyxis sp. TaxID=1908224 RepID=UPI003D6C7507